MQISKVDETYCVLRYNIWQVEHTSKTILTICYLYMKGAFVIENFYYNYIQWNLSNPTHQGTREMCRIVQDV